MQDDIDVPLEAYGAAMAYSLEHDGEHPLFALERGEITRGASSSRGSSAGSRPRSAATCRCTGSARG